MSILIPLSKNHLHFRDKWENEFNYIGVEVLFDEGNDTIGSKRQRMLEKARGRYVVFIDADDEISEHYLTHIIPAIQMNPDVIGFRGWMTTNGKKHQDFWISKTLPYVSTDEYHFRHSNHLAPVKRTIALEIGYKDMRFAEDYDYAVRLKASGLIKTEVFIDQALYHYQYQKKK